VTSACRLMEWVMVGAVLVSRFVGLQNRDLNGKAIAGLKLVNRGAVLPISRILGGGQFAQAPAFCGVRPLLTSFLGYFWLVGGVSLIGDHVAYELVNRM
jgi:hypothetical protein